MPAYAIPGLASFVTVPLLFAALGSTEYGRWALLYGIAAGVPQITTSWLEATVLRFGHRDGRAQNRLSLLAAVLGSIGLSSLLGMVVVPDARLADTVSVASLTAIVSAYVVTAARLQSSMAFSILSAIASLRAILGAVLGILGGSIVGSAPAAIGGLAAGYVVAQVVAEVAVRIRRQGARTSGPSPTSRPERATYGVASAVAAVGSYSLAVGDRFILSGLRPLADVGTYAATYSLMDLVGRFVPSIVITAIRPRAFRAWDRGDEGSFAAALKTIALVLGWVVACAACGLVAIGLAVDGLPVDMTLIGLLATGFVCSMAANSLGLALSGATRQGRLASHLAGCALINLALNVVLIGAIGALGAAIATAVSFALLLVLHWRGIGGGSQLDRGAVAIGLVTVGALTAITIGGLAGTMPVALVVAAVLLGSGAPGVVRAALRVQRAF